MFALWLLAGVWALSLWLCVWPDVYATAGAQGQGLLARWAQTPVHLSDDVMITLRTGYMLGETGAPQYNRIDLAQPSTSYLAPYLFFVLHAWLPGYLPVLLYAALGLVCAGLTLWLIALRAGSPWLGGAVAALLVLSKTHTSFALLGWDHLFQTFLLVAAAFIVLRAQASCRLFMLAMVLAALGVLYRPDGAVVGLALAAVAAWRLAGQGRAWLYVPACFFGVLLAALWLNFVQFGQLTPTTVRLKFGSSPSLQYSLHNLLANAWQRYSAGTLLPVWLVLLLGVRARVGAARWLLAVSALLTAGVALVNGDVFSDLRMLWMPSCILALLVCDVYGRIVPDSTRAAAWIRRGAWALCLLAPLAWWGGFGARQKDMAQNGVLTALTAPHYAVMQWIGTHLSPADGAVGLFWLGMAYHIKPFEVADFLGKGDERIATTPMKWGPPGHNKWDIDASLDKWHPQVIVPTVPPAWDQGVQTHLQHMQEKLARREDWGFVYDLVLNPRIRRDYLYCYVGAAPGAVDTWGMYLRKDVAARHQAALHCRAV